MGLGFLKLQFQGVRVLGFLGVYEGLGLKVQGLEGLGLYMLSKRNFMLLLRGGAGQLRLSYAYGFLPVPAAATTFDK